MAIAKLSIDIEARLAGIEKDLGKVAKLGEDAAGRLGSAFAAAGAVVVAGFGVLGGVGVITAFTDKIKVSISGMAGLKDASEKTGAAVEKLSGLKSVASIGGRDFAEIEGVISRLNKALHATDDESKGAGKALAAIGLDVQKLRAMDPADALMEIAKAQDKFADGSGKSAAMMAILGKTGAEQIPYLKDLAEQQTLVGKVTAEQAKAADDYEKNLAKLNVAWSGLSKQMAAAVVGPAKDITDWMVLAQKEGGALYSIIVGLGMGMAKLSGVEINPLQRAENDSNEYFKQLAATKHELDLLRKRQSEQNPVFAAITGVDIGFRESEVAEIEKKLKASIKRRNKLLQEASDAVEPKSKALDTQTFGAPPKAEKEKVDNTYANLISSIREKLAAQQLESDMQRNLTEGEKLASKVMVEIRDGTINLTAAQKSSVAAGLDQLIVLDKLNVARKGEAEAVQHLAEVTKRFGRANDSKLDALTIMPEAVARLNAELRKVDDTAADVRDRLAKMLGDGKLTPDAYAVKIGELNKIVDEQKSKVVELNAVQDRMNGSWETGAVRALQSYSDSARNVAAQTEQAFSRAFSGMEDALVGFVQTGKLDFSSLADSIISDLIRIQIREGMTKMFSSSGMLASLFGSGSAAPGTSDVGPTQGSWFSNLFASAKGNVFSSPGLSAWSGRIVSTPTVFPFARGAGLMGEAGPEAILPLKRGPGGYLGVRAEASSAQTSVTVNVINQSSQPVTAGQPKISMDAMGQMVVEVMLTDLRRNGPYAQQLKRAG